MTIRAVFFDLGGVILRTEYQAPRQHLADRLGLEYDDLDRLVFAGESSRRASVGEISTEEHWAEVTRQLKRPASERKAIREEFFAGDVLDHEIIDFIRALRPKYQTGLISNAWPDMREYIRKQNFDDAFDSMVISAEVGVMKPEAEIYQLALEQLGVKPNESVFVDDFMVNIKGCQVVGMTGVHFRNWEQTLSELKQILL